MTTDEDTLRFYAREAAAYHAAFNAQDMPPLWHDLAGRLTPGARVLDFGCGGGWAARAFAARGLDVTALDPSAEMLSALDGSGIATLCGDISVLPVDVRFDAVWAHFSLQHIPRDQMPDVLTRLCHAIAPGGYIAIAIHEGTQTLRDSLDRFYCHWPEAVLQGLLAENGMDVVQSDRQPDQGFDGRKFMALRLLAQRP